MPEPQRAQGYVLAFDFGLRFIGVAAGQTVTGTAMTVTTLRAERGKPDWRAVAALIGEWAPVRLLVGLPLNMDGTVSDMSERASAFAVSLERRAGIPVDLVDERLSSREAKDQQRNHGQRQADQRAHRGAHEQAAVVIAETWLAEWLAGRIEERPLPDRRLGD
jgi:putative holliday junction resolvase